MKPKITFALFNYCQARFLPESLKSISDQSDPPDELLVFDDASTDNSVEILKTIPRAKFHFNEKNLGLFPNIKKALEIAENDYICLMAADDLLHPEFIADHRKVLEENPGVGLICSDCVFFEDRIPRQYEIYRFLPFQTAQVFTPEQTVRHLRKTPFTLLSFTSMYNRHLILKYGGYKPSLQSLADFYLNTQIALRHPIGYIPKPTAAARIVSNSYGEKFRTNWTQRNAIYERLFSLVYKEESLEFRKAFHAARLLSFGGLYSLYYILRNPTYWTKLPPLLFKNVKFNLHKIYRKILRRPFQRIPTNATFGPWP